MQEYYFPNYTHNTQADPYNGTAIKMAGLSESTRPHASFSFKTTDAKFTIYIRVMTENGLRYLEYSPGTADLYHAQSSQNSWIPFKEYIHYSLGAGVNDGQWHTITRDLQADLTGGNPGETIQYVEGFYVRMTGSVDNLALLMQ